VCWGAVHAPPYIVKEIGLQVNKIRLIAGLHGDISLSGGATLSRVTAGGEPCRRLAERKAKSEATRANDSAWQLLGKWQPTNLGVSTQLSWKVEGHEGDVRTGMKRHKGEWDRLRRRGSTCWCMLQP
jgi:hypothetical protein